ncbi:MAG TPA: hypothetical protein DIU39_03610 [Flavobacteriales bacterium]|nr:hypothetical protein [Flavobacteriales bacterium]
MLYSYVKWLFFSSLVMFSNRFLGQQIIFEETDTVLILKNNDTLTLGFAGGINSGQYSTIDLNMDNVPDLVVFDRSGNKISTFLNVGSAGQVKYKYAPEYVNAFPEISNWMLLRDYNCDGKQDIFASSSGGIQVYKNTSSGGNLSFQLATSLLYSNYQPNYVNLYVSSADIPAIDDIDNDGDLDILTFSILGTYIEYHKNLTIEKYGTCDSLDYELRNKCWGFFAENFSSNSVTLNDTCQWNVPNPERKNIVGGAKHSGSTLMTLDVNNDNAKELVLGDISFSNMTILINGDNSQDLTSSIMIAQDSIFPANFSSSNAPAVDVDIFPAGFYIDVNNDGEKDLIVSPNDINASNNYQSSWLYLNNGTTTQPDFNFVSSSFLQNEMLEVGQGAYPALIDYNQDGLMDLLVGNYGYFDTASSNTYISRLMLLENIGSNTSPKFLIVDSNYLDLPSYNLNTNLNQPAIAICPTVGDIDGDGDDDLLLGDSEGLLHLFSNTAGAGNPVNFVFSQAKYQGIDVGQYAAPQLVDLNEDNLIDLVVGNKNGTIYYFQNTGSSTNPVFTQQTDSLGGVYTHFSGFYSGYAQPFFYKNANNQWELICGSESGYLFKYDSIDNNLTGTFNVVDSMLFDIRKGGKTAPVIYDFNNDGYNDMILGSYTGGLHYFKGTFFNIVNYITYTNDFSVYPNPASKNITIKSTQTKPVKVTVYNLMGAQVLQARTATNKTFSIKDLLPGMYFVVLEDETNKHYVFKIVKE